MIVITGTGRSGTSFIAYLLHNLDFDLGHAEFRMDWVKNPPFYGCGEDECCVGINDIIHNIIVRDQGGPQRTQFDKGFQYEKLDGAIQAVQDRIKSFSHELVKDPRFSYCLEVWVKLNKAPDLIIDCQRNIINCGKSMLRTKKHPGPLEKAIQAMQNMRDMLEATIYKYNLRRYPVHFPDVIYTPYPLRGLFAHYHPFDTIKWDRVIKEHKGLVDENLIHYQ